MEQVGAVVVQVALGDPNHATWEEGERLIEVLKKSHLEISATMLGYPGEDYASPATIKASGGFGDAGTREERLGMFRRAVEQTAELEVPYLTSHAGFIPEPDSSQRQSFLDCLGDAGEIAEQAGVIFCMETGQETASLLRRTLDELAMESLKINFDPANMVLYDMGDPIHAVEVLGPDIETVHVKDALPPQSEGKWGAEVTLGEGAVGMSEFLSALSSIDYDGPLVVEREVGTQQERIRDIRSGIELLRRLIARR